MKRYFFDLLDEDFEGHRRYELDLPHEWKMWVLNRDRWACRRCNSSEDIQPHHVVPRSAGRDHHPRNLVVLCGHCHRRVHDGHVVILVDDAGNYFFGGSRSDLVTPRRGRTGLSL